MIESGRRNARAPAPAMCANVPGLAFFAASGARTRSMYWWPGNASCARISASLRKIVALWLDMDYGARCCMLST